MINVSLGVNYDSWGCILQQARVVSLLPSSPFLFYIILCSVWFYFLLKKKKVDQLEISN